MPSPLLVRRYLAEDPFVLSFFNGAPGALESYQRKLERLRERFTRSDRERAAAALFPTSSAAAEQLQRWIIEGGVVVTTGQQAGLFTGPLYAPYKIITAIRLARDLQQRLGVPVLPVFWTASEDHDWEEVNHTFVIRDHQLKRLEVSSSDSRALPMSERRWGADIENALHSLSQGVDIQSVSETHLKLIRVVYIPSATVADSFRKVVAELFAPFDLLIADAADPVLKTLSIPVLSAALEKHAAHESAIRSTSERLTSAGYHNQVSVLPNAPNLFFHGAQGRERIQFIDSDLYLRDSRQRLPVSEVGEMLAAAPERFSPNVLLRPVVESAVFPVLSYVAGPGEISYFAQLGGLFEEFGMEMPVIFPRLSATLVEEEVERAMEKLELSFPELLRPRHELSNELAHRMMPPGVSASLSELQCTIGDAYARLIDAAEPLDPTLRGALGASRNRALLEADRSEQKILRQLRARHSATLEQLDRVLTELRPNGEPQERVLNIFPFLARHPDLLTRLAEAVRLPWNPRSEGAP